MGIFREARCLRCQRARAGCVCGTPRENKVLRKTQVVRNGKPVPKGKR